jgi:predicted translation initiation factor SUI1
MAQARQKKLLFLCTGNYYRSRFAEILFNSVATRMGLPWKASSRGLALERGMNNIGPIATAVLQFLETQKLSSLQETTRFPVQVTTQDLEQADLIIALKEQEHHPLLLERFPPWETKVKFWQIDDAPDALALIENEIMELVAQLFGGGQAYESRIPPTPKVCSQCGQPQTSCACSSKKPASQKTVVRLTRETKGRRGKGVTIISDLPLDGEALQELATRLKQRCGTGGTVKDGRIEIQGDQRDRLQTELETLGYRVKRAGG